MVSRSKKKFRKEKMAKEKRKEKNNIKSIFG